MPYMKSTISHWTQLSDFFEEDYWTREMPEENWTPPINVVEEPDQFVLELAVPGFRKEDFMVSVNKRVMTITAQAANQSENTKKNYTVKQFSSKSFTRKFNLPDEVGVDHINASCDKGVFRIILKKAPQQEPVPKTINLS